LYVITFYSFKGGVGRTMALVNVAAELVRRGRKVLVVDFDLEAPGLETYKHLRPDRPHPGIVEYVTQFRQTYAVPDLREFVYETKPIGKKGGRLWVMPAGRRDKAYRNALVSLDWKRLYQDQQGFLLFEDTKKGWEEELKPDYVLIDSRTGYTDVLGICTRQLPDSVVLMFTPNEQNLAGLENVCRDIRREETEGLKKKIALHFVAANVPDLDDEYHILRRQLQAFHQRLEFNDLTGMIRRYESLRLLDQSVVVLDRPRSRLARSYRRLTRMLIRDNLADRDAALSFLNDVRRRIIKDPPSLKRWLKEIAGHFLQDPEVFLRIAECQISSRDIKSALKTLDHVVRLQPGSAEALFQRALCKACLEDKDGAVTDLFACLQVGGPEPQQVLRIYSELGTIARGRLSEAVALPVFQEYPPDLQKEIACILGETEQGLSRAIDILRELRPKYLQDDEWCWVRDLYADLLLRARRWDEVIEEMHALDKHEQQMPKHALRLAFACWGKTGIFAKDPLRCVLEWWAKHADTSEYEYDSDDAEDRAWALWGTGQTEEALNWLDEAKDMAREEGEEGADNGFSRWRWQLVPLEEYREDLVKVRRLFEGESLRPAFLGPP
jgi:MinD-like ATPase involved in chromosome partitioning or flagellar assembly